MRRHAIILAMAAVSLVGGCATPVYTPDPQGPPGLTVSEARRSVSETLRAAKVRGGVYYRETRVSDDGFSLSWLSKGEAGSRSYRFGELKALTVKQAGKVSVVELGREAGEQPAWESPADARRFVDAVQALGYLTSSRPLFNDNQRGAKSWP